VQKPSRARVGVLIQNERGEFLTAGTRVWRKPSRVLRTLLAHGTAIERHRTLHFLHDVSIVEELRDDPRIACGTRWRIWKVTVAPKPSGWKK
jgi:hypothetical protein